MADDNPYTQFVQPPQSQPEAEGDNPYSRFVGVAPASPSTPLGAVATDVAKSLPVGVAKAGIGLAGMPGDLRNLAQSGGIGLVSWIAKKLGATDEQVAQVHSDMQSALEKSPPHFPTSDDIRHSVEGVTGEFYKPQTLPGEYAQTVGEFAPAMLGPTGAARGIAQGARALVGRFVGQVAAPAAATEAAGQIARGFNPSLEPWARGATSILASGAAGMMSRPGHVENVISGQLPEGVTPAHVQAGQRLIEDANARGINLTWPEALSQVSRQPVLTDAQRILESSRDTRAQMQGFFADRPQAIEAATRAELGNVGPATNQPSMIGPTIQRAAENEIGDVRGLINAAAEPYYRAGEATRIPGQIHQRLMGDERFAAALESVRNDPYKNSFVAQYPDNTVGVYNAVKKELGEVADNAMRPTADLQSPTIASAARGMEEPVRNAAIDATRLNPGGASSYETALNIEHTGRGRFLDRLLAGPIGRLAETNTTTKSAIDALFPRTPLPGSEDEVFGAVRRLTLQNPQASAALVRAHVEQTFDEAMRNLQLGPNQFGGAKFFVRIAGNDQQRANLRAAVQGLPNGQDRWEGFGRLLDIAEATGTRQPIGSKTSFNAQELADLSRAGAGENAAKTALGVTRALNVISDAWGRWQLGRNLDSLAHILTDPQSGPLLQRLAAMPPGSRHAQETAARIIANASGATSDDR